MWCVKDVAGIMCAFLTWVISLFGVLAVTLALDGLSEASGQFFYALLALSLTSHVRAMTTNPGGKIKNECCVFSCARASLIHFSFFFCCAAVSKPDSESVAGVEGRMCRVCNGPKPPRAHHCSVCNRCVMVRGKHSFFFFFFCDDVDLASFPPFFHLTADDGPPLVRKSPHLLSFRT
jgi:hypothetical protein